MTTKPVTPAEVAGEIFDVLGKRDLGAAMALVADDTVDDFVAIGEVRGKVAIRRFFEELLAALPDFEITVGRIVADDAAAAVQWRAAGSFWHTRSKIDGRGDRRPYCVISLSRRADRRLRAG